MSSAKDVTQLLTQWSGGDQAALERLLPLVYDELRRQARRYLGGERPDHTLQPTALVHEAYVRLIGQRNVKWQNRAQFFGVAAQLMRRILVDHARARAAAKRGGGASGLALSGLAALDPVQGRVVELRFFGGLTIDETAEVLHLSPATIKREWSMAKAWLHRALHGEEQPS